MNKFTGSLFREDEPAQLRDLDKTKYEDGWMALENAKKDGSTIQVMKWHEKMPEFHSAWWMAGEVHDGPDGREYDGHLWILDDDQGHMVEEDEDLSLWFYKPLPKITLKKDR